MSIQMQNLTIVNIKQSINLLNRNIPRVDSSFIKIIEEPKKGDSITADEILVKLARNSLTPLPWFYNDKDKINSLQRDFFGFYALRNIVRGTLLGADFLKSGNILYKKELFSPALSMYYNAAFHFLHSLLAINGRVIIEPIHGPVKIEVKKAMTSLTHGELLTHPEVIIGILTKNNKWIFENRKKSHKNRWFELLQVFKKIYNFPAYFRDLFEYMSWYGPYQKNNKLGLKFLLKEIAEMRHSALYRSFALDDFAFDAITNGDLTVVGLDLKVKHLRSFSTDFLKDIATSFKELNKNLDINGIVRIHLFNSINTPPFEFPHCDKDDEDKNINEMLASIMKWLFLDLDIAELLINKNK